MFTAKGYTSGLCGKQAMVQGDKIKKSQATGIRKIPYKLSDEIVLDMRTLSEFKGWSHKAIIEKYSHLDLSDCYIYQILTYATRSKLIPMRLA